MNARHLIVCMMLAGLIVPELPFNPQRAEAAQTVAKKTKKTKKVDQKKNHAHGLKTYPWGAPNAGWDDRCIFFYDTYDGWIPPFCRPYGRMH